MADALISPAVGGTMLAVSAGLVLYSAHRVRKDFDPEKIPLMGVMGAFVFAMQMINFAIPGTGSSGHIGGAVLLAALLGAYPAFLALACVLLIQALFFADGGLLALGCNIFNMGFFGCFIAYPLVFKPIAGDCSKPLRVAAASIAAVVVGLQLGSFCVVLETLLSGVTKLPFATFAALMQPIHLAIGTVEGVLTAFVIVLVYNARPQIFSAQAKGGISMAAAFGSILLASLAIGGGLSILASGNPDGLEWAIEHTTEGEELAAEGGVYDVSATMQEKTSFLPDYSVPAVESENFGTSLAGIVGSLMTLGIIFILGFALRRNREGCA